MEMNLFEMLKVILIGIVEGITEWLPISSTGHMLLVDEFLPLKMPEQFKEMFFVVIQLGAILAVVVVFWKKMFPFQIGKKPLIRKDIFSIWFKVVVACIPAGVAGLLLDEFLEEHFGNAFTISLMLILYGVAFLAVERWNKHRTPLVDTIDAIDYKTALLIGAFQALSLIPGHLPFRRDHRRSAVDWRGENSGGGVYLLFGGAHHAGGQRL